MKKLLLILLCLPMIGFGQGWTQTFGGHFIDRGRSVQQTTDGGYIVCGVKDYDISQITKVYLIKIDVSGNTQWAETYHSIGGIADGASGYSVKQTSDGGYIICGDAANNNNDILLIKTNAVGDTLWTKTHGSIIDGDIGRDVCQTIDGGYIIVGYTGSLGGPNGADQDLYLVKTDGNGDSLWTKTFGGTSWDYGISVKQTTDGGYIMTGFTWSFAITTGHDVWLIKTDSIGNTSWTKTYGSGMGNSVQQTNDGGYIICGNNSDVLLIKTDENGNEQWSKNFGGIEYDSGESVQQTTDGGYIVCGMTGSFGDTLGDVWLLKTDYQGDTLWTQTFGGIGYEKGYSVQQTTDGGYIISGETSSNVQSVDVYLIKTDGNGNIVSSFTIPISSNRELKNVVDILGREVNPEKNQPLFYIYDDGTVEKRIVIE